MRKMVLTSITAAACALGLSVNAGAAPQNNTPPPAAQPQAQQQTKTNVSQQELKRFAATYQDVTDIRDTYQTKLQQADNKEDAQKIANQAQKDMKATIKDHGFTMDEYTSVVRAINTNPDLQAQFREITSG